jgi:DNA-directed RNA polymerase subunit K/omega
MADKEDFEAGADDDGFDGDGFDGDDVNADTLEDITEISNVRPELKKLYNQHPELIIDYAESLIPKLVDKDKHTTYPFLTLYEKTKIIGLRANQLSQGSKPFIAVPEHITNVRDIAKLELEQKRLPYIIKRPLANGKYEYWRLIDLMVL